MSPDDKSKTSQNDGLQMWDDAEYQRQLALFVRCSTDKPVELLKIGEIIAGLSDRRTFLDIGAGGGDLTIPISGDFKETTVVEPNEKQAAFLGRRCPQFTVYNDLWETVDLASKRYDLILCSHVLYYIGERNWLSTIDKMYAHLEDRGRIIIIMQSPMGEVADFFNQFTSYDVNIIELWRDLIRQYGDDAIDVRYYINDIYTETSEDMVTIGLFLLLEPRFKQYEDEMRRYFETHHKVTGGYRITQDVIVLVVKKG